MFLGISKTNLLVRARSVLSSKNNTFYSKYLIGSGLTADLSLMQNAAKLIVAVESSDEKDLEYERLVSELALTLDLDLTTIPQETNTATAVTVPTGFDSGRNGVVNADVINSGRDGVVNTTTYDGGRNP